MNKGELVEIVSEDTGFTKADCGRVIESVLENIKKNVKKGDEVKLTGFGTFAKTKRKARTGRNPQTGKEIKIAACWAPKFRAGKEFKDLVR